VRTGRLPRRLSRETVGSIQRGPGRCQPKTSFQVDRTLDPLAGCLLPPRCGLRHGSGQRPARDRYAACEADLPARPAACPRRALPTESGSALSECVRCRDDLPPCDRGHGAFRYGFPLDGLVQGLQHDGHLATARVLGSLLGRSAQRAALHLDVLVAVFLHPEKVTGCGFNRLIEIACWVARAVQRPSARVADKCSRHPAAGRPAARRASRQSPRRVRRDRCGPEASRGDRRRRRHDGRHGARMRTGPAASRCRLRSDLARARTPP
jgi:predicted amidophosphoribosyltransferase